MVALGRAVTADDTVFELNAVLDVPRYPARYVVDDETVEVTGGDDTRFVSVRRGADGTTPASHAINTTLTSTPLTSGGGFNGGTITEPLTIAPPVDAGGLAVTSFEVDGAGLIHVRGGAVPTPAASALIDIVGQPNASGSILVVASQNGTVGLDIQGNGSGGLGTAVFKSSDTTVRGDNTQVGVGTDWVTLGGGTVEVLPVTVKMAFLPTTDPLVAGQLWIDTTLGRVIKVSAG